jgi:hypothetical protein
MYTYRILKSQYGMPAVPCHDIYWVRGLHANEDFGELFGVLRKLQAYEKTPYAFRLDQVSGDQCITVFVTRGAYKKWTKEQHSILCGTTTDIDPIHEVLLCLDPTEFLPAIEHPCNRSWRGMCITLDYDDDDEGPYVFLSEKDVIEWVHDTQRSLISFVLVCFLPPHRKSSRSRPCRHLLTYDKPGASTNKRCLPPY